MWPALAHLTSTLQINLKENVTSIGGIGDRGPVEMIKELRKLKEAAFVSMRLKCGPIHKDVGLWILAHPRRPCGPTPRKPERVVAL